MSDQSFHEIQLSGKQLVFLFMSLLVLAVVVFLLGVSVGRGVRAAATGGAPPIADTGAVGDTTVPATMPPATKTSPNELDYHERLQGRAVADPPRGADQPPAPASGAPSPPARTQPPAAKPPAPTVTPSPSATSDWVVQIDSFKSRNLAETEVTQLKTKGFTTAFIVNSSPPGPPYKVRVGPFAQRAEAQRAADRLLKLGYKPSVIH